MRQNVVKAQANHSPQTSDKKICRGHEHRAGFAHSAQVDKGEQQENSQTDDERMRLKTRHCRYQGAHARGNPHRHGQRVVDHQGGSGQQARAHTQVLTRYSVRAAAGGISLNRLAIGKIDNRQ